MFRVKGLFNIKTVVLSFLLVMVVTMFPVKSHGFSDTDYIKVGLKYGNFAVSSLIITSQTGFYLGTVSEGGGFSQSLPLPGYNELIATVNNGCVELRDNNNVLISADLGNNGVIVPYQQGGGQLISFNNEKYRGGLMLKADKNGKMNVVNYLPINEYLYGVVHREMGMTNPMEALKAQAVTARTFAVLNKGKHGSEGFDVCFETHCQVYGGFKDEYESTNLAVDVTKDLMVYYKNELAEVYYYKNSGGHTQNSEEEWSNYAAHLRGKPDPYSPVYPWKATMTFDTLRQKLIQAKMDPGSITWVKVGNYDSSGAVSSLLIKGSDGEVNLSKSKIRAVLGSSLVRSRHFSLGDTYKGGGSVEKEDRPVEISLLSSKGTTKEVVSTNIYILSEKSDPQKADPNSLFLTKGSGSVKVEPSKKGTGENKDKDEIILSGGSLVITGVGYGHGVGMAQDGAIEMAKQGMNFLDILNFYYSGIEVF